ncbi:unnamed protein product [Brassica rapa subsp. trilocularis]
MARYVYGLIFLIANLLAWAARDYGRRALNKVISTYQDIRLEIIIELSQDYRKNPQHVMFLSTLGTLKRIHQEINGILDGGELAHFGAG